MTDALRKSLRKKGHYVKRRNEIIGCDDLPKLLRGADLRKFGGLYRQSLTRCNFSNLDLRGANLSGCILFGVTFYYADLRGADLSGTLLDHVNFHHARIDRVNFGNAMGTPINLGLAEMDDAMRAYLRLIGLL